MQSLAPLLAVLLLALAPLLASADRPQRALLALDRNIVGDLVSGRNVTVQYVVHNVGGSAATSISLKDPSFPQSRFELHSGSFRSSWASLDAGEVARSSVVMQPRRGGELFVSAAAVSYADADGESRTTRLASQDSVVVEDLLAFRRRTDRHRVEWTAYAGAFALLVAAPLAVSVVVERGVPVGTVGKKRL